jgi:hypothetical protein
VAQLANTFFSLYGTWRFITMFTRERHWCPFWARWIRATHTRIPFLYDPFQRSYYSVICS